MTTWGSVTDPRTRLGSAQRLAEETAAPIAATMNVDDFQVIVTTISAPVGTAHTLPELRRVEVAISTVEYPDPRILRATLAHELAHIGLGVPRWERWIDGARLLAPALGAIVGVLAAAALTAAVAHPQNILLSQAMSAAAFAAAFVPLSEFLRSRLTRRLELRCDIEAAHQVGDDGLALMEYNPEGALSRVERFGSDHPPPTARAAAIRLHADRRHCECPT
ncbi:M48 family metalloprotease [Curtobacterium sp. MCBA15_007]|uniref:M48 family metalloprotease n=1 Tax=Curtobacterium sp. MCBA15_007 TaxID=1898735 RepID=UPI0020C8C854|nr:M48 family metalloprotease [Curtobacterium sp. MCBA15_007]